MYEPSGQQPATIHVNGCPRDKVVLHHIDDALGDFVGRACARDQVVFSGVGVELLALVTLEGCHRRVNGSRRHDIDALIWRNLTGHGASQSLDGPPDA